MNEKKMVKTNNKSPLDKIFDRESKLLSNCCNAEVETQLNDQLILAGFSKAFSENDCDRIVNEYFNSITFICAKCKKCCSTKSIKIEKEPKNKVRIFLYIILVLIILFLSYYAY